MTNTIMRQIKRAGEKGERVFEKSDTAKENSQFAVGSTQLTPGFYLIEISTKDKNGEEVKDVKYIELYDEKNNRVSYIEILMDGRSQNY